VNVLLADDLFVLVSGQWDMRHRLHAIRHGIGTREHGDHTGRGACGDGLDTSDARVRVRRAHEARVGLTRQVDVVAVTAAAGHQASILLAEDVLAYALTRGSGSRLKK